VFTDKEIEYLTTQRIGRLATVTPACRAHAVPTGFHLDTDRRAIQIGGHNQPGRGQSASTYATSKPAPG
jgi:pyridoxamine 5'-phosphate oxidase family protein